MLNTIKNMIKEKNNFLEAADIIFEDGSGMNLDDKVILGEANDLIDIDDELPLKEDKDEDLDDKTEESESSDNNDDKDDILNDSISNKSSDDSDDSSADNNDNNNNTNEDNILSSSVDDDNSISDQNNEDNDLSLPGDDLPNPVGRQTGEPINSDNDLLNVEIDLGSNIVKDVLPIPPANARDVVPEDNDILNQHVDSGFGDDEEDHLLSEDQVPMDDSKDGFSDNIYHEAISIGDADPNETTSEEPAPPTDDDTGEVSSEDESPVTAAVKDKVSEINTENPVGKDSKEDLLKKLGNITKSLEDAKKAVMNSIQ